MNALVTGGGGFIGSNLALELERRGFNVTVLDDFSVGNRENLNGFEGEIISEGIMEVNLNKLKEMDFIFHQAAITNTTVKDKELMMNVNLHGFKRFLDFAVERGIPFIYASSAAVYGSAKAPQKESDAGNPNNSYGESKWLCDCTAKEGMEKSDSLIAGLRYFNVFGPRERFKGKMASMVWQLSQQMLKGKKPRIFKYGEQKRDQLYAKDAVKANLLAMNAKENCIVNVGSGKAVTFNYIIETLNKTLGFNYEAEYFDNPFKEFYQEETEADLSLAGKYLGYKPEWSFEEAVKDYFKKGEF